MASCSRAPSASPTRFARSASRQEERVALLLHDTVDYPVAFWGTVRAGRIAIPLNTFLNVPQYAYILADSRATALVAAAPLAQTIWPIIERLPHLRTVILVGAIEDDKAAFPGRDVHLFEDIIAAADSTPFTADTVSDEVAFWIYTSGSTGDPKGVKHVHSNLMATAKLFGQGVLGISENDVVHSAAKLFFAYGLGNAMTFPLSVGATAALWPERPSPELGVRDDAQASPHHLLRRAVALHRLARASRHRQRRRLRPAAPLRVGRRSAARPYRRALAQDRRRRRARRHRLDRTVADVPEQPPGRHSLWLDRQAGAGLRGAHRRREGPRARHRRDRRIDHSRAVGRRRLLEPARQEPAALSPANGPIPATNIAATPTATITTAGAPTTCSRSAACGCRRSTSRPR